MLKIKIGTLIFLLINHYSISQELEPRYYAVVPKKYNVAALSYTYTSGNIIGDATAVVQDLKVNSSAFGFGFVHTFGLFNKLARIQLAVPYILMSGNAKINGVDTSGSRNGFADARIKLGVNLLGSPAMLPAEFSRFKEETVFGASLVVAVPIGQYFSEKLINLGTNRFAYKPEIGFSRRNGAFYFEVYTGVWLFGENNNYLGNHKLEQAPLFSIQTHFSYLFKSRKWIAVNAGLANGGQTKLDGTERGDAQNNFRLGGTFAMPLGKKHSLRILINTGVSTLRGGDFNTYSLAYTYGWAGKK